jgi:hypothetical protein
MNPETKMVLDALSKRFDDLEARWEQSFTEAGEKLKEFAEAEEKWEVRFSQCDDKWERQFADLTVAQDAGMEKLERVTAALDEWKPEVEGTMHDIRIEVGKLSKHRERAVRARSPPLLPTAPPPNSAAVNTATAAAHLVGASAASADRDPKQHHLEDLLGSASGRPPASDQADRPHGHYFDNFNREDGYGLVTTLVHPRVKVRVICLLLLQNWVLLSCLVLKFLCIVPVTNGDL